MSDYEEYLERYCKCRHITKEEAEKHMIVRTVKDMYESAKKTHSVIEEDKGGSKQ